MLFFGEVQVFNSPASTHSFPSQVHFLGITWPWPTCQLYNKCSAFRSAYYCSNPYHSAIKCTPAGERRKVTLGSSGLFRRASCFPLREIARPPQQYRHSARPLVGAQHSFHTPLQYPFCSNSSLKPGTGVKHFILSSFSLVPFASRNIPVVPARLLSRGKASGSFVPFVFAKRLHSCWRCRIAVSQAGALAGEPLLLGHSYMAQGMEQLRKDQFTWLPLGDPASAFYADDCMLISNTAQPKGRGFFDSLTTVMINYIPRLSSGQSFGILPSLQIALKTFEDKSGGSVHIAPNKGCWRSTHSTFHLTPLLRRKVRHVQQVSLR